MKQVGLITGASSGIGKELARIHAKKGRDLIVIARREEELKDLKTELEEKYGVQVMVIAKDLTESGAAQAIYEQVKSAGITLEYLLNNAGFGGRGKFWEQDLSTSVSMINLNVMVLVELTHLFLKDMVANKKGRILQTSSTAAYMPGPLQAVYFATKAFVNSFSHALASELEGSPVTITTLNPGAVKTEFAETAGFGNNQGMFASGKSPRYTAERGYSAMEAGKLEEITEFGLKVMIKAGMPFTPAKLGMSMVKKMQAE